MLTILAVGVGAIALFIPTLIIVVVNWLLNRSHEKKKRMPAAA